MLSRDRLLPGKACHKTIPLRYNAVRLQFQIFLCLAIKYMSGISAESKSNLAADGEIDGTVQIQRLHDDNRIRTAGADMQMDFTSHHLADFHCAFQRPFAIPGKLEMFRSYAQRNRTWLHLIFCQVLLFFL